MRLAIAGLAILMMCDASVRAQTSLQKDRSSFLSAAFSPDGKRIAAGSYEGTIRVWDVRTGKLLRSMKILEYKDAFFSRRVYALTFSPNGRQILSGSHDAVLRLWDIDSGKTVRVFKGHQTTISSLGFSPDGRYIASGASDPEDKGRGALKIWNVASGKLLRNLGVQQQTHSLEFSPDGKRIVSGGWDKSAKKNGVWVWNVTTGQLVRAFGRSQEISAVDFSRDGKYIVSCGTDAGDGPPDENTSWAGFKVWDSATGKLLRSFCGKVDTLDAEFSPNGQLIVSANWDINAENNGVHLWNAKSGGLTRALSRGIDSPYFVSFNPDGKTILSGSGDAKIKLWDAKTGKQVRTFDAQ